MVNIKKNPKKNERKDFNLPLNCPFVPTPAKPIKKRRRGTVNDVPEKKLQRNYKRNQKRLT